MSYYTYRIRVSNRNSVQVEKRGSQNQDIEQPSGKFSYRRKLIQKIENLIQSTRNNTLNNSHQCRLLGETLFNILFDDRLCQDFINFYERVVQQEGQFLRVELDIDEQKMPEVAALPWEFMCIPESANQGTLWLGTAHNVIFSRRRSHWTSPQPIQLKPNEKLRMALVISAPEDLGTVVFDRVQQDLENLAATQANRVELLPIVHPANPQAIDAVLRKKPHLFHFIGHGRLQNAQNQEVGEIALVDDLNCARWVDANYFGSLFNRHRPGVVVLQACEGGMLSPSRAFVGVASRLMQQNVPVVVAMQYEVSNSTAGRFARCFYEKLAEGNPVDVAAQSGRLAITFSPTEYRTRDFATPVIFMRVQDGHLFQRQIEKTSAQTLESPVPDLSAEIKIDVREQQGEDTASKKPLPSTPYSNLTPNQKRRFEKKRDDLQQEWDLRNERLQQLRTSYVIEAQTAHRFQLQKQIQDEETQLAQLNDELDKIEQALSHREYFSNTPTSSALNSGPGVPVDIPITPEPRPSSVISSSPMGAREDWGDAPSVPSLFGRDEELQTLKRWILEDNCRLVAIVGMAGVGKSSMAVSLGRGGQAGRGLTQGGIGKTDLSVRLAKDIGNEFQYVFWQRLLNPTQPSEYLSKLVSFLSDGAETELPNTVEEQIKRLFLYLNKHRCLLILDNFDTVMQPGENAGKYLDGYEAYGQLLKQFGEVPHQSCLLLTSRERPREIEAQAGNAKPVRFFELEGVDYLAAKEIFEDLDSGFSGSDTEWQELTDFLRGNVLALELAARHIKKVFAGKISGFLKQENKVFQEIRQRLLDWHFEHLSEKEQEIVYWLAINRKPISIDDLKRDILLSEAKERVSSTIELIEKSLPLEYSNNQIAYTLQPVLIEDATRRLMKYAFKDLVTQKIDFLNKFALLKAITEDDVREAQRKLIIQPILHRLTEKFDNSKNVKAQLTQLLSSWQKEHPHKPGYLGGNILNLLCQMGDDLKDYDFSHLIIRQAYLEEAVLHGVNFANADLTDSVFADHFGTIRSIAFSRQHKFLAGCGDDGLVRLWREGDWEPVEIYPDHTDVIRTLAFNNQGTRLASAGDDRTLFVWNVETGKPKTKVKAHTSWIRSLDFSPDDSLLASCGADHLVKIWDVETLKCRKVLKGHQAGVLSVRFSPDGKTLASGGRDNTVKLWNVETGRCIRTLTEHNGWVYSVCFSGDGKTLASGSGDRTVKLWNMETYQCIDTLDKHKNHVESVVFSPDGEILASGDDDGIGILWDVRTHRVRHVLQGHQSAIGRVSFNANSSILASCSSDCKVRLWNVQTGQCIQVLYGHSSPVWTLAYNPNGRLLASSGKTSDGKEFIVTVWNMQTGQPIKKLAGHKDWILTVAFSPNGNFIASGSEDQTVRLWDMRSLEGAIRYKELKKHEGRLESVTFSPDGKTLASAGQDYQINLWDVSNKVWRSANSRPVKTWKDKDRVFSVKFNSQGTLLASGGADSVPKLWVVNTGELLRQFQGHTDQVWTVAFSPNDQILATGSDDCTIKLWDVGTGQCLKTLTGHEDWIWSVAFNADGTLLASASGDYTVKVWHIDSGECLETLEGHNSWVWRTAFSPDGATLASCSSDETVKIWDIQEIGVVQKQRCLQTLKIEGPYQGMNITGAKGLTDPQKLALKALGAVED
ncbi:hypothetical protein BV372_08250 [Nostoc sp. T09]|uniref:WD40 domain-containing protein n=1 Tax=Nostoc sp. T09 TaxID=1932621 RepID=UPI000A397361|nr:CHAT domain-containing protein [Nostoc sp. T09]OUL36188.1 hypothetical protein BV372_08250 [Nostoc sp. T09]